MSRKFTWRTALTLAAIAATVVCAPAAAQEYGSVFGSVTDDSGAKLPGVTVTLTGGGAPKVTVTNAQGAFRVLGLDPGTYGLTAELDSFGTVELPTVTVGLNRSTNLDITMNAAISETITVTSETPLLDERRLTQGTSISNVELEKIPSARDPWAVLNQAPGVVVDRVNVGGNESGQQSVFRASGVTSEQNDFQVDGVQITDMAAVGSSPTYYDFDQFEAVEVATGGTDVTKNTSGAGVNLVTKRGTNEFRGSARMIQSKDSFFGDVFGQGTTELSPSELGPNQSSFSGRSIQDVREQGIEAGGPAWRDKLWFWGSYGRNDVEQVNFGGGADNTILENYSFKVNAQATQANSLVGSINVGDKKKFGRGAGTSRPDITTWNQRGPTDVYKLEDTHVFNSNFYLTGQYSKVDGGFSLLAKGGAGTENSVAPYFDAGGVWQNTYWSGSSARPSEELRIDGSYFFNTGDLSHELKFGGRDRSFESFSPFFWPRNYRSLHRDNVFGVGSTTQPEVDGRVDFYRDGVLPLAADYSSYWVQDTLSKGNWTINAGFRFDLQEGLNSAEDLPALSASRGGESCVDVANGDPGPCDLLGATTGTAVDPGFEWEDITPRLGVTYALGEERKTLLRGSFSQFPEALETADFSYLSTSASTSVRYFYEELGDDGSLGFQPGIDRLLELNRVVGGAGGDNPNQIDPGLDAPITSELLIGVEHAFLPEFVVGATFTIRETDDILEFRDLFETPSGQLITPGRNEYIQTGTVTGTLPNGTSVTQPVFSIDPSLGLVDTGGQLFTNGPRSVEYQGFGINFTKRLANRWMLRGFFNFGEAEWDVPDSFFDNQSPNIVVTDPNGNRIQTRDRGDRDGDLFFEESGGSGRGNIFLQSSWSWNLTGMYQVAPDRPWGFNVSANIYGREGYPVPYFFNTADNDGFDREIQLGGIDDFRTDDIQTTDLRVEKEFAASGNVNLTFGIDLFNVFDEDFILARQPDLGAGNADEVQDVLAPRVWKLGVRVGWR